MGYISKDIAVITEPDIVTLSAVPNFVQFASKPASKTYLEVNLGVNIRQSTNLANRFIYDSLISNSGDIVNGTGWVMCEITELNPGQAFTIGNFRIDTAGYGAFYNGNTLVSFVGGYGNTSLPRTYVWPSGATRFLFDVKRPTNADTDYAQTTVNKGNVLLPYETPNPVNFNIPSLTLIRITDASGAIHTYRGTTNTEDVGGSTFYVSTDTSDTAENLRQVLLADKWFSANYEAVIPFVWQGESPGNGSILNIKSKGAGTDYNITIEAPNNTGNVAYTFTWVNQTSRNNDSISGEASTAEIDLDIYTDPDVFLGQDDRPITPAKIGTYAATMQKTYTGSPVWFELNALFSQYGGYNRPPGTSGWFDTGTSRTYRFTAKVKAINSFYFYQSNALYVLHGYGPASEDLDLSRYVYNENTIRLLTDKPRTPLSLIHI